MTARPTDTDPEVWREAEARAKIHAPYLVESLSLFPKCIDGLIADGPDVYVAALLSDLPDDVGTVEAEMAVLRTLKRHAHLAIALSDIANVWDWDAVTEHLSQLSDIAMARLLRCSAQTLGIEGTADNPVPGLFILAVGKYGARELNYSSDIDFCVFYDPDIIQLPNMARAERTLIKFVQSLIAGFERITAEGYIFRTDLRLRPDPRSNSVAVSTLAAERYYETIGQNWERAAMIKARICGGDRDVGADFIKTVLTPFIWRRSLDYAAIEDIHSIKRQMHTAKSGVDIRAAGHHLKLGYGGIREIEFYAQTQQLILGGRLSRLRTMRTVDALTALTEAKAVSPEICTDLIRDYGFLRKCEHAAQMMQDAQTHICPEDDAARTDLARLVGYDDLNTFDRDLVALLRRVHSYYIDLFPESESLSVDQGNLAFTGVEPGPSTLATLSALGFVDINTVWTSMADWLGGRIAATRSERARELLTRLAPRLITICSEQSDPDQAFVAFSRFFTRLNAGVGLLSMFLQEPQRLADIIAMMTASPRLSDMLSSRPSILDAMIDPSFLAIDFDALGSAYAVASSDDFDFENHINHLRRLVHEDQFRVNAAVLSDRLSLKGSQKALSRIADRAVEAMLPIAAQETERVIGDIGSDYAVLAMGKAGGRELSLRSDLDVMILYQAANDQLADSGRHFTKLTQRFVSAASAVTAEGTLYEIDMALRPSGRSGPVAVSLEAFSCYYREKAWTWEFMALTRARIMASGSDEFSARLDTVINAALMAQRPDLNIPQDIADMLQRLRAEKPSRGSWDVKQAEGGLRDIEFIVQKAYLMNRGLIASTEANARYPTATIDMINALAQPLTAAGLDTALLLEAAQFYHNMTQALTLTRGHLKGDPSEVEMIPVANLFDDSVNGLSERRDRYFGQIANMIGRYVLFAN